MKMKPLVYTENDKFVMMIKNVDGFLESLQDDKSNMLNHSKCNGVLSNFIPELDDLGLHEVCNVYIHEEKNCGGFLCKTNIEIFGDNGAVYLSIIHNPTFYG